MRTIGFEKLSGRACCLLAAIYSLTFVLKSLENSPISTKIQLGWSEARSRPPSQQNMFENRPCFRTFFKQKFVNFIAELLHLAYSPVIKILKLFVCQIYMVEETEELFYFFIHIKVQIIRIDQS